MVVYNTNALTEADLPDSIWDFTDPKWKGRIGWPPTNASFQAMVTGMRVLWGEDKTEEWLRGIMVNERRYSRRIRLLFRPQLTARSTSDSSTTTTSTVSWQKRAKDSQRETTTRGAADPGSVVLAAGAGILKSANNREGAESFLKFLLSVPGQQYFASQTFEYPLVDGVKADRLLTPLDQITKPDIDLADISDLSGTQALLREVGAIP